MKKLFRFADLIVLVGATIGMLLQLWIFSIGTDAAGLYPKYHPATIMSWVLSGAMLIFIFLVTRQVGRNRDYRDNFPASIPAALGCLGAALVLGYTCYQNLMVSDLLLDSLCNGFGLLGSVGLAWTAYCRYIGKKPSFICYLFLCVFFALYVFTMGRDLGGEPETVRYLFRYLAVLSLIPACYQFWGFTVDAGERQNCLFWSLLSGYLCILSTPSAENGLMYLLLGVWMLTNPCLLKYLPRRRAPMETLEVTPEPQPETELSQPEIPCTMEETFQPAEIPTETTDEPAPDCQPTLPEEPQLDVDAIIAQILRDIDSQVQ